jgi:hypothetical protein
MFSHSTPLHGAFQEEAWKKNKFMLERAKGERFFMKEKRKKSSDCGFLPRKNLSTDSNSF